MTINKYSLLPDPREVPLSTNTQDVYLQIFVGNGQQGGNLLTVNGNQIPAGDLTNKRHITDAAGAANCELNIITNVLDISWLTNNCVITTKFTDQDGQTLYQKVDKGIAEPGGIASFNGNYIFRLIALFMVAFCLALAKPASAQNAKFEDLEMPTAPGFILYDETPEAIERPTTPQGLAISGLNAFQSGGAIEFSPFWLFDHPNFTASKVTSQKMPILSQLSLSTAYINQDSTGSIAFGVKTRIYQYYNSSMQTKLDSLRAAISMALTADPDKIDTTKIAKLTKEYTAAIEKPVFLIDLAGAYGGSSSNNSFQSLTADKWGVWLSMSYRPGANSFYLTGLARVSQSLLDDGNEQDVILDLGARLNYEIQDFTISGEFLSRSYTNSTNLAYERLAIIGSYKLSDGIYFTGSIGKNYEEVNNLFVLGGLNFGISKEKPIPDN